MTNPEPWLRGPLEGVHPLIMPVFFSFSQVREDLAQHTRGLTFEQVWRPVPKASVGFHLKHMAGSVDRLVTYLLGSPLSPEQLASLQAEHTPDQDLPRLLAELEGTLQLAEVRLKTLNPADLYQPRYVGRKALPTSVIGLIVHLAEHTQRHLGQTIAIAKIVRHFDGLED